MGWFELRRCSTGKCMNVLRPAAVQCLVHSTNGLLELIMVQHSQRWLTELHHTLESLVFLDGRLPVSRQGPHKMTPERPKTRSLGGPRPSPHSHAADVGEGRWSWEARSSFPPRQSQSQSKVGAANPEKEGRASLADAVRGSLGVRCSSGHRWPG